MVTINLNNNSFKCSGNLKVLNKIRNSSNFKVRHPNAYFLRQHMPRGWDGHIYYMTDTGVVKSGLLPQFIETIQEMGEPFEIVDNRNNLESPQQITHIGNFKFRDYQIEAISKVINNEIADIPFRIGVLDMATNAGKFGIMCGIHKSFNNKKTIVLLNRVDLLNQSKTEGPEILGDEYGFVQGKNVNWNNFTIAMVQTLSANIDMYKTKLASFDIVLVDECDLADNKSYKKILKHLFNASVRVGLSGTIYMSKLKKHLMKNQNLRCFFGDVLKKVTKKDMVEMGYSTKPVIKIVPGNLEVIIPNDYDEEYKQGITLNEERHKRIVDRLRFNINRGRIPALVVCKYIQHVELLTNRLETMLCIPMGLSIKYIHNEVKPKDRKNIIQRFASGNIDILVASWLIQRGHNMPLIKYIANCGGGDSNEVISQIMGRGERKHESKNKIYIDDFYDIGKYLKRHSNHRVVYYQKEDFKVIQIAKKNY